MLKGKGSAYALLILSLILYIVMGYGIQRHETLPLFACYFALFLIYLAIIRQEQSIRENELKFWIAGAIVLRAALLFSVPALSDDFYRFIWDGRLLSAGYHPFAEVPSFYMSHPHSIPGIDAALYNSLGAKETFTVYPPVSQLIFWLAAKLSPHSVFGSVIVMRLVILGFEIATLWILAAVLRQFRQPPTRILIYALNPLVILELTGNLHFEGIMIFFLLLAIPIVSRKPVISSVAYGLSICTKLIPLIFLPLLLPYLGWKKAFRYWLLTMAFTLMFFMPLLNREIVEGLSTSLGYYFQRFEFNASVYYLIREGGFFFAGFNIIQYAGPLLALTATIAILYISFRHWDMRAPRGLENRLFTKILWCLFIYFLCVTILHPWYIVTLLAISTLTPYRFPLVWTGAIFLTYAGYTETDFDENLFLVALEYLVVIAYLLYEVIWMKQRNRS